MITRYAGKHNSDRHSFCPSSKKQIGFRIQQFAGIKFQPALTCRFNFIGFDNDNPHFPLHCAILDLQPEIVVKHSRFPCLPYRFYRSENVSYKKENILINGL